jgi:hypothetical protein
MKKFNIDHLPNYKRVIESQPHIINSDLEPVIIPNVLSQAEIKTILQQMEEHPKERIRVQEWGGQANYDTLYLEDSVIQKATWAMNRTFGEEFELYHYSVVKYSNKAGFKVKLFPHYDTRPAEMFVFDLQLKSNEDWGIVVEGEQYNLKDNQALIFSGTQQIHWRENKQLSDSCDINMVFIWFTHKTPKTKSPEHDTLMKAREEALVIDVNINPNPVKNDGAVIA